MIAILLRLHKFPCVPHVCMYVLIEEQSHHRNQHAYSSSQQDTDLPTLFVNNERTWNGNCACNARTPHRHRPFPGYNVYYPLAYRYTTIMVCGWWLFKDSLSWAHLSESQLASFPCPNIPISLAPLALAPTLTLTLTWHTSVILKTLLSRPVVKHHLISSVPDITVVALTLVPTL